jgi:2,3-bisphosphoglycerate-dependent phosphoglycerate mutase
MDKDKPKLILMRHGQSQWNKLNLFTGWVDVPLSKEGIEESIKGGEKIKDIPIDVIFTSTLIRAQTTLLLAMLSHKSGKTPVFQHSEGNMYKWGKIFNLNTLKNTIPVYYSWHLNERMYGELQGLNKNEMIEKYGAEQVKLWRRSYDVAPPNGESLKMTAARTLPYFKNEVVPHLEKGKNVFISAHGNSLRSIIMDLEGLSEKQVVELEIPTGEPLFYRYDQGRWLKG